MDTCDDTKTCDLCGTERKCCQLELAGETHDVCIECIEGRAGDAYFHGVPVAKLLASGFYGYMGQGTGKGRKGR
jgi:hypothetical protein